MSFDLYAIEKTALKVQEMRKKGFPGATVTFDPEEILDLIRYCKAQANLMSFMMKRNGQLSREIKRCKGIK